MKAQRVVWPSLAKVDVETFTLPPTSETMKYSSLQTATLISPGTERAFLLGLPNAQGQLPVPSRLQQYRYSDRGRQTPSRVVKVGERVASTQGHTSHFVTAPNRLLKVASD